MFGQLDLGSEEGEDQLMKMMQGMMSTLLSKDVLYPSLKELCKQVTQSNQENFNYWSRDLIIGIIRMPNVPTDLFAVTQMCKIYCYI